MRNGERQDLPDADGCCGHDHTEQNVKQDGLAQDVPAVSVPSGSQVLGDLDGKAHGNGAGQAVH